MVLSLTLVKWVAIGIVASNALIYFVPWLRRSWLAAKLLGIACLAPICYLMANYQQYSLDEAVVVVILLALLAVAGFPQIRRSKIMADRAFRSKKEQSLVVF